MAGMSFEGTSEDTDVVQNKYIVSKTEGGIESVVTWTVEPGDGGSDVRFEAEYTVPIPLLGKLAEAFIVKLNENEADAILANLKSRMEI